MRDATNRGFWYGIGAYASWGVFPLYWKLLAGVPVVQVVSHRILWSTVLLGAWIALRGEWATLRPALGNPAVWRSYALAAALIAVNWGVFIWAVQAGFVVEASLGYFINPLLSVLLGVFVLGESLRPAQRGAVALAAAGVLYLALAHGAFPWISLALATSFALYGLVKKMAPLGSVHGLVVETGILAPVALVVLVVAETDGRGALGNGPVLVDGLLLGGGAVTIAPLLMFASAARSIPLLWIGILQYIAPSLQLAIGVLVYGEPFAAERATGFALVWAALLLFAADGIRAHRAAVVAPPE